MARPGLFTHRKLRKLSRLIGSKALAVGSLELIWHAGYSDGDPRLGDASDVEAAAEWCGKDGVLADALCASGFIDRCEDGTFETHDFYDHAPEYVRKRIDHEDQRKAKGLTVREIRQEAGRKGAASRWQTDGKGMAKGSTPIPSHPIPPLPIPEESEVVSKASTTTLTVSDPLKNAESDGARVRVPKKPPGTRARKSPLVNGARVKRLEDDFMKLYEFYPRHVGRDAAWRAFVKLDPELESLQSIVTDIKRRIESGEWIPNDPERVQYIPHMSTYLNQRRWTDEA